MTWRIDETFKPIRGGGRIALPRAEAKELGEAFTKAGGRWLLDSETYPSRAEASLRVSRVRAGMLAYGILTKERHQIRSSVESTRAAPSASARFEVRLQLVDKQAPTPALGGTAPSR